MGFYAKMFCDCGVFYDKILKLSLLKWGVNEYNILRVDWYVCGVYGIYLYKGKGLCTIWNTGQHTKPYPVYRAL